jgi:hypothetical protein
VHYELLECTVCGESLLEALDESDQCLPWIRIEERFLRQRDELGDPLFKELVEEGVLVRVAAVHGADTDAGFIALFLAIGFVGFRCRDLG